MEQERKWAVVSAWASDYKISSVDWGPPLSRRLLEPTALPVAQPGAQVRPGIAIATSFTVFVVNEPPSPSLLSCSSSCSSSCFFAVPSYGTVALQSQKYST